MDMKNFFPSRRLFFMSVFGVLLNIGFVWLARRYAWPVYCDSVGTVLAAVFGGYLPGIVVGCASNALNSISHAETLYYCFISVLLGIAAARMAEAGWFRPSWKILLTIPAFAAIGGLLGSLMTWLLYGFRIGTDVSSPYAHFLAARLGLPDFWAQLFADCGIDLLDKTLTVGIVFTLIRLTPRSWSAAFPFLALSGKERAAVIPPPRRYSGHSLHTEIAVVIGGASILLGLLSVSVGYGLYKNVSTADHVRTANGLANAAKGEMDPDSVNRYLKTKKKDAAYFATENEFRKLLASFPSAKYLYVYQIREDGCHVVFDMPTADTAPGELGEVVPFEQDFLDQLPALRAGKPISPMITRGLYGWLLTVYHPIFDGKGNCVAYICVDQPMEEVISGWVAYWAKLFSVLFGALCVIVALVIHYVDRRVVNPINAMAEASGEFLESGEDRRMACQTRLEQLDIRTGNELENLYLTLTETSGNVTRSENEKRIILDNIRQPIGLFDANCDFIAGNRQLLDLHRCGSFLPEANGMHRCNLCGGSEKCVLQATVDSGTTQAVQRRVGDREYRVITEPVFLEGGVLTRVIISFVDMTEINAALRRMEKVLAIEREELKNRNLFLGSIGHELRTPLNAVLGFSDLLAGEGGEYASSIRDAADRMRRLLDAITELSQLDSGVLDINLQPCDVLVLLKETAAKFSDNCTSGCNRLRLPAERKLPLLLLDSRHVGRILCEILDNACKYTRNGEITLDAAFEGGELRIFCRDTGFGIPEEKQSKIFEPFVYADAVRDEHRMKGEGLGLAFASRLARCMGGAVELVSSPRCGSTFTLVLPVKEAPEDAKK